MAREDEMALMLKTQADEQKLTEARKENAMLKKHVPGLPAIVDAAIVGVAAAGIGVAEGYQHGGDPAKKAAQAGYLSVGAIVVGAGGAVAVGGGNPKARSALKDVAVAGVATLAYTVGEKEGVQMALAAAKARAAAPAPGVQGYGRK